MEDVEKQKAGYFNVLKITEQKGLLHFFKKRYQLQQSTENTELSEKSEILWFVQNSLTGQKTEQLGAPAVLTDILGVCHSTHIAAHNRL